MSEATSSIRVIPFSGKATEWPVWSEKFLARARRKSYKGVLTGKDQLPATVADDGYPVPISTEMTEKAKEVNEKNEEAYEDLILSISGETEMGRVVFQMVKGSKTKDFPDGDCCVAWKRLNEKFEPTTTQSRLDLKREFQSLVLKGRNDPDIWLTKLEDTMMKINNATSNPSQYMTEVDILEQALNNVPKEYDMVIETLQHRIDTTVDPLTISELRVRLRHRYTKLYSGMSDKDKDGETALFAGGFKGKCNNCGKIGHKAKDCRDKGGGKGNDGKRPQGRRFAGKCN